MDGGGGRRYTQHRNTNKHRPTYYTALAAHIPLSGGVGRRTDHGDDGGPPGGGGGGSDGLTAATPCWLLLAAAAKQQLLLGTTVVQQ